MKIVILRLNSGDFGKIGTYNVQEVGLAKSLISKGHEVKVLFTHKKVKKISLDDTYSFVYYLPHFSIGLHGIINISVLNDFLCDSLILFSDNQLWAKNVINWCKRNAVVCVHYFGGVLSNSPFWLNQLYTKAILLRNIRSYNYSINIAKTKDVEREMTCNNLRCDGIIHVGLDESVLEMNTNPDMLLRQKLGYSDNEILVLFVGRTTDDKQPLLACDIIKSYLNHNPNAKLILIGKGPLDEEIEHRIEDYNLQTTVVRKKSVPYCEMYKYFVSCDCLINLSHIEIFGMTILESMYYGLPVVAHSAPGPSEIIEDNNTGLLLNTDQPNEWVNKIECAINNRQQLAKNAREKVKNSFVWDRIADQFLNYINAERG